MSEEYVRQSQATGQASIPTPSGRRVLSPGASTALAHLPTVLKQDQCCQRESAEQQRQG